VEGEYERWAKRDLTGNEYVYLWADGVHFGVRWKTQISAF